MIEDNTTPYPWFGGKAKIAPVIWSRLGMLKLYVEPFFGGGAVYLAAPTIPSIVVLNDLDGLIVNFWRAVKAAPHEVAEHASWPPSELDLIARKSYLQYTPPVGIVLDPPYGAGRCKTYEKDSEDVVAQVAEWAIAHGDDPNLRIVLCGYEYQNVMPDSWACVAWEGRLMQGCTTGRGGENKTKERVWFSPHCLAEGDAAHTAAVQRGKARKDLLRKLRRS